MSGSRNVVVVTLLLLVLGLAALLAAQVQVAAAYHRNTAEGVLRDYAALAASRVAGATAQELYGRAALPTLAAAERSGLAATPRDSIAAAFARRVRYTFRLDPSTRRLRTRGTDPATSEVHWLTDTLTQSAAAYEQNWYFAAVVGAPRGAPPRVVLLRRATDGVLTGGVADLTALTPLFEAAATAMPLLPRSLTRGAELDFGTVRFGDASGAELYASGPPPPTAFVSREDLAPWLGGMWVEVALRPEIASQLLIGGLPRSRLPLVLAVLAVAAALTAAALLLIRREAELARLRSDLVAGVSHELRTPLAQIRMFGETLLLERVRSEDERRRSLAIIDQEARRLTHLVENLLHFSRSERRLARVTIRPVDLAEVVREAVDAFAPLAAARQAVLHRDVPPTLPGAADPDAIRQILLNLLDNAVKYGPAGQTVTVALSSAAGSARLAVLDQGPGIPISERERVWERFVRLSRDRGSAAAGTGIGLAVVRELAALHGGRTWIEGAPAGGSRGSGARVVVEWPLTPEPGVV